MTENAPEQQSPAPSPADDEPTKRYAAYDKTYLRFVGGVHDTKTKATRAARDAKVKSFEIREV